MRTGWLWLWVLSSFTLGLSAGEAPALSPEWAFVRRFPDTPVAVYEIKGRKFIEGLLERTPGALLEIPGLENVKTEVKMLPSLISMALWLRKQEKGRGDPEPELLVEMTFEKDTDALYWKRRFPLPEDVKETVSIEARGQKLLLGTLTRIAEFTSEKNKGTPEGFAWLPSLQAGLTSKLDPDAFTYRFALDWPKVDIMLNNDMEKMFGVFSSLGFSEFEPRIACEFSMQGKQIQLRLASPSKKEPVSAARLLFPAPTPLTLMDKLPSNLISVGYSPIKDGRDMLNVLDQLEDRWGADVAKEYREDLAELDRDLGFNLREDLLAHLKGGMAILRVENTPVAPVPDNAAKPLQNAFSLAKTAVYIVRCDQPDAVHKHFEKLPVLFAKKNGPLEPFKVVSDDVNGIAVRHSEGAPVYWAFKEGLLYLGGNLESLKKVLTTPAEGQRMSDRPMIRTLSQGTVGNMSYARLAALAAYFRKNIELLTGDPRPSPINKLLMDLAGLLEKTEGEMHLDTRRENETLSLTLEIQNVDLFDLYAKACAVLVPLVKAVKGGKELGDF